ncbi:SDR family oxidoreductase [Streptomyces bathyalis]|uniref:SDR family oxidoreductase n=1 Tax=Streptomyces bathyalis TaxID=2710756 RepID=A0A7T1T6P5_9ACTN|nr:SDR family oxidoreductase [Streptomyces bathyalis]QPP07353.1 SDR family oxidoreductase [Streptomyces bathyalis]
MSRVVIVSGGGTGIGRAVARGFAADGDSVLLVGRRAGVLSDAAEALAAEDGISGEIRTFAADLSDPAEAERVRAEVDRLYGRVDVLVNNAGGNVEIGAPDDAPGGLAGVARHWTGNFNCNVLTCVLLTEALRDLLQQPGRRVVLISSIAAYRGSGSGSYAASKAALHPYAYDLAGQLGGHGATVNVVAPGFIEDTEFFGDLMSDERRKMLVAQTDNGRAGTPADIADTVHWLSSPGAGHVTGQVVQVNGGAQHGA